VPVLDEVLDAQPPGLAQLLLGQVHADAREHLALDPAPHRLGVDEHAVHVEHAAADHARRRLRTLPNTAADSSADPPIRRRGPAAPPRRPPAARGPPAAWRSWAAPAVAPGSACR